MEARLRVWQTAVDAIGLEVRCAPAVEGRPPGPQSGIAAATAETWCPLPEVGEWFLPRALVWVAVAPHVVDWPRGT